MYNERKIGILLSYIKVVLSVLINIVYVPILLHYLGKSEYGLYQIVGSFFSYITVFESCMASGVMRNYCNALGEGNNELAMDTLSTAHRIYRIMSLLMIGIGIVVVVVFRFFYRDSFSPNELQESGLILDILFLNLFVTLWGSIYLTVITGKERFIFLRITDIVLQIAQPVMVILCVAHIPYAISVSSAIAFLNILNVILRWWYVQFRMNIKIPKQKLNRKIAKEVVSLASAILIGGIADQIFWKTDQIILGKMFSTAVVAVYSVGAQIYMMYMQFGTQVASVFYPRVSILYNEVNGLKKVSDLFIQVGRITLFVIMLILSGFIIFGRDFFGLWVGDGYDQAYWVAIVVMIPFSIDLAQTLGMSILQLAGKYNFRAKMYLLSALLNIITTVLLSRLIGIVGAAISTGISMLLTNGLIMNWYYCKHVGLDIPRYWKETIGIWKMTSILTIIMLIAKSVFRIKYTSYAVLGIAIVLYTAVYAFSMLKWVATISENEQIKCAIRKVYNH